jgi:deoxyuridine 5'-triphosphate nucleotidohydrolase
MTFPPLKVKRLLPGAVLPTVAHSGHDLGYDLYAAEAITIPARGMAKVKTGIAIEFTSGHGALLRDRSSMASKGLAVTAGVIDAGYRGEIQVIMHNLMANDFVINAGDKVIQMIPVRPETLFPVEEVEDLSQTARGAGGFGSTGK